MGYAWRTPRSKEGVLPRSGCVMKSQRAHSTLTFHVGFAPTDRRSVPMHLLSSFPGKASSTPEEIAKNLRGCRLGNRQRCSLDQCRAHASFRTRFRPSCARAIGTDLGWPETAHLAMAVIPAKAGIHVALRSRAKIDSRFRGNDGLAGRWFLCEQKASATRKRADLAWGITTHQACTAERSTRHCLHPDPTIIQRQSRVRM